MFKRQKRWSAKLASRAVAYLNRGDVYWQLHRPAAAQADYRRYLLLLHTQRKDTPRVPAYVQLTLRLPAP